jgi:hypothetical protein
MTTKTNMALVKKSRHKTAELRYRKAAARVAVHSEPKAHGRGREC